MKAKNRTKWNRAHEFQWHKKTKSRKGHPAYVFGKNNSQYKFFCFTHSKITDGADNRKLKHNIDWSDSEDCYIRPVMQIDK